MKEAVETSFQTIGSSSDLHSVAKKLVAEAVSEVRGGCQGSLNWIPNLIRLSQVRRGVEGEEILGKGLMPALCS